jgi:hypothetical protein
MSNTASQNITRWYDNSDLLLLDWEGEGRLNWLKDWFQCLNPLEWYDGYDNVIYKWLLGITIRQDWVVGSGGARKINSGGPLKLIIINKHKLKL